MIRVDCVLAKTGDLIKTGQQVQIKERKAQQGSVADMVETVMLQLAYSDDTVAVCVKPAGMPVNQQVHPIQPPSP